MLTLRSREEPKSTAWSFDTVKGNTKQPIAGTIKLEKKEERHIIQTRLPSTKSIEELAQSPSVMHSKVEPPPPLSKSSCM
jgi:hypothetical protein